MCTYLQIVCVKITGMTEDKAGQKVDFLAQKLWNYHYRIDDINKIKGKADVIICFTSIDPRPARYSSKLFIEGYAPLVVFSGKGAVSDFQKTDWGMPEAVKFKEIALGEGVPENKIIVEDKSENSQQNVEFVEALLAKLGIPAKIIILVHKPTMVRRAYATFKNFWKGKTKLYMSAEKITYDGYMALDEIDKEQMINIMVGDLQRIKLYPDKGFQIFQEIPEDVWDAYEELVKMGYDKHLIS